MKKVFTLFLASSILTACGGGGGDSPAPAPAPAPAPVALPLAAYVGTWKGPCDRHEQETTIIAMTPDGSGKLDISGKTEFFANADCSGAVLGTETNSANTTATFSSTVDASVQMTLGAAASTVKVDKMTLNSPPFSRKMTGPGVTYGHDVDTASGLASWCITYASDGSVCVPDAGVLPATSRQATLYLRDNQWFFLIPGVNAYAVEEVYTKQ